MDVKNYELAEQDYMAGMKYKEIAAKYGVTLNREILEGRIQKAG